MYEGRYGNQEKFDVVISGGIKINDVYSNTVINLKGPEFETPVEMSPMLTKRSSSKSAVIGNEIYVLGGYDKSYSWTSSFEVYSSKEKCLKKLKSFSGHLNDHSVCSFMKGIYVIGGYFTVSDDYRRRNYDICCYKYEVKFKKWTKVEKLQIKRSSSACTVFEGKVVVTVD